MNDDERASIRETVDELNKQAAAITGMPVDPDMVPLLTDLIEEAYAVADRVKPKLMKEATDHGPVFAFALAGLLGRVVQRRLMHVLQMKLDEKARLN